MASFCFNEAGAYRVTFGNRLPHMEFVLDSAAEVVDLPTNSASAVVAGETVGPCAPGSVALVPSTGEFYMMDCTGSWFSM